MTASSRRLDFSNDEIADAALDIIRREGADSLSFRRVAEVIGTYHVAVFRRCGGFDGLLDMCAEKASASFPEIDEQSVGWPAATEQRFQALYDLWTVHVDLVLLMRGRAWLGENMTSRFYEPAMRTLINAGLSTTEATRMFSILYRLTIGSIVATKANPHEATASRDSVHRMGADRFPTLARINDEVDRTDMDALYRDEVRRIIADFGPGPHGGTE